MEMFPVTYLSDHDSMEWTINAATPEEALDEAVSRKESAEGVYSVWDPQDVRGMPLLERVLN